MSAVDSSQPTAFDKANATLTTNAYAQQASSFLSPDYQEPFFGCFSDTTGCGLVFCCPCVPLATARANVDGRRVTLVDFLCCPSAYQVRQGIRAKHHIPFHPLNDCVAYACCFCCAMHQDVREIARREGKPPQFYMDM